MGVGFSKKELYVENNNSKNVVGLLQLFRIIITFLWLFTRKEQADGEKLLKLRLVIRGFNVPNRYNILEIYALV